MAVSDKRGWEGDVSTVAPDGNARFRALIIESDHDYCLAVHAIVSGNGCAAQVCNTLEEGLEELERSRYNVVVLGAAAEDDVAAAAERIHEKGPIGLVILDERLSDAREAYEAGADQLLPKPFVPGQLAGALRAALRSRGPESVVAVARTIRVDDLVFDAERRELRWEDGSRLRFSAREWELLAVLLSKANQYFTAEELRDEAWGDPTLSLDQVRGYIYRLRQKLSIRPLRFAIVHQRQLGYCMRITPGPPAADQPEAEPAEVASQTSASQR